MHASSQPCVLLLLLLLFLLKTKPAWKPPLAAILRAIIFSHCRPSHRPALHRHSFRTGTPLRHTPRRPITASAPPRRSVHTSAATTRDPCPQLDDGTSQCALAQEILEHALITCRQPDLVQLQSILVPLFRTKPAAAPHEQDTRRHNNNCPAIASHDRGRSTLVIPAEHNMELC